MSSIFQENGRLVLVMTQVGLFLPAIMIFSPFLLTMTPLALTFIFTIGKCRSAGQSNLPLCCVQRNFALSHPLCGLPTFVYSRAGRGSKLCHAIVEREAAVQPTLEIKLILLKLFERALEGPQAGIHLRPGVQEIDNFILVTKSTPLI